MKDEESRPNERQEQEDEWEDGDSFQTDLEGMSDGTVRIAIDRHIRKKLMEDYDLLSLQDAGRYFTVTARSKDRKWFYELMVPSSISTAGLQACTGLYLHCLQWPLMASPLFGEL